MALLINGFSKNQYSLCLYRSRTSSNHWIAKLNHIGSTLINRLVYFLLNHCSKYPANAYLLDRFKEHEFSKIESTNQLHVALEILQLFKECKDLNQDDQHLKVIDELDHTLIDVNQRLSTPNHGKLAKRDVKPAEIEKAKSPGKKSDDGTSIKEKTEVLEHNRPLETDEEEPPKDLGNKKLESPKENPSDLPSNPPKNEQEIKPLPGGFSPPPPPPPPPPSAPAHIVSPAATKGAPPPPPPPIGMRGGPIPPPPPSGGPKGKLSLTLSPGSPSIKVTAFLNEPAEPAFKPTLNKDALESMPKQQLESEIAAIETYVKELKTVLEPLQKKVEEEQSLATDLEEQQSELNSIKKQLEETEKVAESLALDSQETVLKLNIKKDEAVELPLISQDLYDTLNKALQESGFVGALSTQFLKSKSVEHFSEQLEDLERRYEELEQHVPELADQLKALRSFSNNGIPLSKFKQLMDAKKLVLEKWERALTNRKKQLDVLAAPPKAKPAAKLVKAKGLSLADAIKANPDLASNPTLGRIAAIADNQNAQIIMRQDTFRQHIKA